MEERNILSSEEVDAIIKSAQTASALDIESQEAVSTSSINTNALNNIIENTRAEIENKLTVLLRKKIIVKNNPFELTNVKAIVEQATENNVYTSFKLHPSGSSTLVCADNNLLDVALNLLYGGKLQAQGDAPTKIGKIGVISAEKISGVILECLAVGCKEYDIISHEMYKASLSISNVNNLPEEEPIYKIDFIVMFDERETKISLNLTEEFLIKMIPFRAGKGAHREKDFWRTAIKSEVIDSYVTVNSTMADQKINLKDFMALKEGDEIEIGDPTVVYVCLNNLKLFRALACQSNDKIVVKIVSQV